MKRYTKEKNNMEKQTNGLGIASMITGIISVFVFPLILGVISALLGLVGLKHEKNRTAVAGIVLGIIGIAVAIFKLANGMPTL